ncbi:hypothetical protein FRX31_032923 [Thalictrum thalictroides]|uniref:Reverse transcriptase zinc-binding domain-containing protein n=1 Tax=Thalictrum thalictroides TaxID=46969 RepID=A0A7J6UZ73_THATH|nr:hypothetical protein FRX31_032923 [Thalictrum thalictroides]
MCPSSICSLCGNSLESVQHLFFQCTRVRDLWDTVIGGVVGPQDVIESSSSSVADFLHNWLPFYRNPLGRKLGKTLPFVLLWTTCKFRNDYIFRGIEIDRWKFQLEVKAISWYWLGGGTQNKNHRFEELVFDWQRLLTS